MEEDIIENFNDNNINYALSSKILNSIIRDLKLQVTNNFNLIEVNNEIDMKYHKKKIKLSVLLSIIDSYENDDYQVNDDERKLILYNGDPYLTMELIMDSLINGIKTLLIIDKQFMLGVNRVLFQIVFEVLKNYNIRNLIFLEFNIDENILNKIEYDEFIIIGDTFNFEKFSIKYSNVKFYPYNNILIYSDNEEFNNLKAAIYVYSRENLYEYEELDVDSPMDAIECAKMDDTKDVMVLFTRNSNTKKMFLDYIKDRELVINENPFIDEYRRIEKYL